MAQKLILASASPRRRELLAQLGLDFKVIPSGIDETSLTAGPPELVAVRLAEQKAADVAMRAGEGIVIGADTIVVVDDSILGKPKDENDARKMLTRLSGRWHRVYTGIAVIHTASGGKISDYEESRVKFKKLSPREIENYIKTGEPMDKAGGYGIQGKGALLVEKIEGCYYNIVGLPLFKLGAMLSHFGVEVL
ncbi:Maf family protein [Thermosediminibacter oceani]|uniref:dTTP/UTP pyrophosphatase n=1 Tax=Thermosediminibacter oceani (strain ATCC BAA-1034 / DSM 16646 / JW/IW-1228P) TaxID=555079 RepID=D9S277_THEOJ|nr:Maf family protein [Thermosediminibacter oceani]ADL07504.1 maf protein [Thermosediminibacter oceani DSM 16646]